MLTGNFGARPGSVQPVTPSANEGSSGYVILYYKSRYGPLPQRCPDNFVFVVSLPSGYDMPLGFYLFCQGGVILASEDLLSISLWPAGAGS